MYGEKKVWGCKWMQQWRGHVKKAVDNNQRLQVYYFEDKVGKGKIESWEACQKDAVKRDSFWPRKQDFLASLPESKKERLESLSAVQRDDSQGEQPGSERGDAEEALFMSSLPEEDRLYLVGLCFVLSFMRLLFSIDSI